MHLNKKYQILGLDLIIYTFLFSGMVLWISWVILCMCVVWGRCQDSFFSRGSSPWGTIYWQDQRLPTPGNIGFTVNPNLLWTSPVFWGRVSFFAPTPLVSATELDMKCCVWDCMSQTSSMPSLMVLGLLRSLHFQSACPVSSQKSSTVFILCCCC